MLCVALCFKCFCCVYWAASVAVYYVSYCVLQSDFFLCCSLTFVVCCSLTFFVLQWVSELSVKIVSAECCHSLYLLCVTVGVEWIQDVDYQWRRG